MHYNIVGKLYVNGSASCFRNKAVDLLEKSLEDPIICSMFLVLAFGISTGWYFVFGKIFLLLLFFVVVFVFY